MPRADLACHSCRKRKVKCDRGLPRCVVCTQTSQTCDYPLRPMKPGPKIGSLQKQRVRHRSNERAQTSQPSSRSRQAHDPVASPNYEDNELETDGPVETVQSEAMPETKTHQGDRQQTLNLNIHDLSFILHPSHESTTPICDQNTSPGSQEGGQAGFCRQACTELGVPQPVMNQMIRVFFDNMVAMNIFHEPSFAEKLLNVTSLWQLTALLAAIAGYASHFLNHREGDPSTKTPYQSEYFVDLAFHYVNKALVDCDDEMPPLCLLQALIVATHCQLAQGVRGKAWRSLGLCIRLAYETNLHVLDSRTAVNTTDPDKWQADEEKRRVFWAIWEMDVFASTIRRTPTAIDWRQMEILLPVDNAHWFQGQPTPSCFMDPDPNQCWKGLQDSGNQSPKAWFLVINSFMKKAQSISDSQWPSAASNLGHYQPNHRTPDSIEEGRQKLEILANAVRCLSLALPSHMRYYDQYLAFGPPVQGQLESQRQQHCSIYNIFIMIQLARLMIYRYDAFKPQSRRSDPNGCPHPEDLSVGATLGRHDSENVAQREYFDAADRILRIVTQSCEEHIKYINPFLASTLWLASAVQLVRKHFARAASNRSLIKSRFDVLYLTYRRCVDFWGTKTALQRNLESLEEQLEARKKQLETRDAQNFQKSSKRALKDAGMISQPFPGLQADHIARHAKRKRTSLHASHPTNRDDHALRLTPRKPKNNPPTEYIPETPTIPIATSTLPYGGLDMRAQSYAKQQSAVADSMPILGTMPLPPPDRNHTSETYMMPMSLNPFDTPDLGDTQQDLIVDWCNPDLSGDLQDLLARWTTY